MKKGYIIHVTHKGRHTVYIPVVSPYTLSKPGIWSSPQFLNLPCYTSYFTISIIDIEICIGVCTGMYKGKGIDIGTDNTLIPPLYGRDYPLSVSIVISF